jgi:hypothetical protein
VKCCQICDEERFATVKCLNCEDYLCKQCHEYHTKVKLSRSMLANSIVFSRIGILAFRHAVAAMTRCRSPDVARRIVFTSWCLCAFVRQSSHITLLQGLQNNKSSFPCILCRSKILVPEVGVTGFKSYSINQKEQYPDKTQGDVKFCQICDEERFAIVKCLNCEDYLCKQCH